MEQALAWKQEAAEIGEDSPFVTSLLKMTAAFATKRKAGEARQGAMGTKSRLQPRYASTLPFPALFLDATRIC